MKKLLNKKKKKTKIYIILLLFVVLSIGIGYSYLKETLTINSNTEISSMRWDVHLENVNITNGSIIPVSNPTIGNDRLSVTSTLEFTQPGEYFEYTVNVVNSGSIDAMIDSFNNTALTESQKKYLTYTATYLDGKPIENDQLLRSSESETIKVRISVKEDLEKSDLPQSGEDLRITFKINYVQADDSAEDRTLKHAHITRQNEGQITPGDVVTITRKSNSERFLVVSSTNQKLVLVTGYCLDEDGNQVSDNTFEKVQISDSVYWDNGGLLSPYNENSASYSGNPYPYVYDSNSLLEDKVNAFGTKVGSLGVSVLDTRLMSYEEANNFSERAIEGQYYLLGSAQSDTNLWSVASDGSLTSSSYSTTGGLRPVIEIGISELAD